MLTPQQALQRAASKTEASWSAECIICMSESRSLRFNCGHLVACEACARKLESMGGKCPVCKERPISCSLFADLPPLPGRQPTYESAAAAFARIATALSSGTASMQEEAAFALLQKVANCNEVQQLVDRGIIAPLVALVTKGTDKAAECAIVTLGMMAPVSAVGVIEAGAVGALFEVLARPLPSGNDAKANREHAALAISGLAEAQSVKTCAAALEGGGFASLVAMLCEAASCREDDALEAAIGALANLAANHVAPGDNDAGRNAVLMAVTDGGADVLLRGIAEGSIQGAPAKDSTRAAGALLLQTLGRSLDARPPQGPALTVETGLTDVIRPRAAGCGCSLM